MTLLRAGRRTRRRCLYPDNARPDTDGRQSDLDTEP